MKKLIPIIVLVILAVACTNKKQVPKPFTKDMLETQTFTINSTKDTALETLHGSIIRIQAGSFTAAGNIQVEIKEAFTPAEMLAAGLTTESNGRLLKSAGMIYINASSKGKTVELLKPVKVSMPNTYYEPEMKIFKGVETDSGTINWVDPVAADTTPQANNWMLGMAIFESKCASCHSIFKRGTGPGLGNVEDRVNNRDLLKEFIRNPIVTTQTSEYFQCQKNEYGSMMTAFPELSEADLDAIFDYIKTESKKYTGPAILEKISSDSLVEESCSRDKERPCGNDTIYLPVPKQNQSIFETDIDYPTEANKKNENEYRKPEDLESLRNGFTDPNPTDGMYDFEIKTLGWYNIDAYVEGYAGTSNVKLAARVRVEFEITMHVYLFCPKNKMLSVGYDKQGDTYLFNKIKDRIPLFINDRAILFAFGSNGDKMFYGISEFSIQGEQTIEITVKETTEEKIRAALYAKEIEGIDLGIEKKEQKIIKKDCDTDRPVKDTIGKAK